MSPGDHIEVYRLGYSHHGIYIGDMQVIHYALMDGDISESATIHITSLEDFTQGLSIYEVDDGRWNPLDEVVNRAYSRLGEQNIIY